MNQQQVKYTTARIDALERRKLEALRVEYQVPAKSISDLEVVALIKSGSVPFREVVERDRGSYLQVSDVFDLSAHTWYQHQRAGYEEAVAKVKAEANRVRDEVMLGDNAAALELLRAFEAGE